MIVRIMSYKELRLLSLRLSMCGSFYCSPVEVENFRHTMRDGWETVICCVC